MAGRPRHRPPAVAKAGPTCHSLACGLHPPGYGRGGCARGGRFERDGDEGAGCFRRDDGRGRQRPAGLCRARDMAEAHVGRPDWPQARGSRPAVPPPGHHLRGLRRGRGSRAADPVRRHPAHHHERRVDEPVGRARAAGQGAQTPSSTTSITARRSSRPARSRASSSSATRSTGPRWSASMCRAASTRTSPASTWCACRRTSSTCWKTTCARRRASPTCWRTARR